MELKNEKGFVFVTSDDGYEWLMIPRLDGTLCMLDNFSVTPIVFTKSKEDLDFFLRTTYASDETMEQYLENFYADNDTDKVSKFDESMLENTSIYEMFCDLDGEDTLSIIRALQS